jgi:hypothetical protein
VICIALEIMIALFLMGTGEKILVYISYHWCKTHPTFKIVLMNAEIFFRADTSHGFTLISSAIDAVDGSSTGIQVPQCGCC